jgi:hypothetical protein
MKSNPLKKQGSKKNLIIILAIIMLFTMGILALTHDIILTNYFAYRICKADPQPKTFIKETVSFPESIYWEDNVYPGFDEKDRLLMIRNYLDGVHLKTMALNAPDGAIYLFTATAADWQESKDIKALKRKGNYFDTLDTEAGIIAGRSKLYTPETLPQLNYSVVFNPVALTSFQQRYLWSDEVIIRDNKTGEVIGFNRRLMHRWYILNPDVALGNRYYYPHAMCGESGMFLEGLVYSYAKSFHNQIQKHAVGLNFLLYKRK